MNAWCWPTRCRTGPNFGQQTLDRDDFARRGSFSAVFLDAVAAPSGLRFRIGPTDGQGANVRPEPGTGSPALRALREGAEVGGDEHAWRQVTDPAGDHGWMANEFLSPIEGRFRVANTEGHGANLRRAPGTSSEAPIKLVPEGTDLTVTSTPGATSPTPRATPARVAEEFLTAQS